MAHLQQQFLAVLQDVPKMNINGNREHKLPNILNLCFSGVDNEALIASCTVLAFSAGSACTSATMSASHVLQAMGISNEQANSSVRISFGRFTTEENVISAANTIKQHVARLRQLSPLWQAS